MKKIFSLAFISEMCVPFAVSAASTLNTLLADALDLVTIISASGAMASVIAFFYGIAMFIWNEGNAEKKEKGRAIMTWGVVAMFLLVTIWGVIGFIQGTIGNTTGPGNIQIVAPKLP